MIETYSLSQKKDKKKLGSPASSLHDRDMEYSIIYLVWE